MIKDLTKGEPLKLIIIFSIPLLIGNIFQQLYNIADLVIVGRLLGVEAFASVGAVAPLFFLIMFIIVGLTNGFAVVTGQKFGAKDTAAVKKSVVISTVLSLFVTLFFTLICSIIMHPVLRLLNVPENIYKDAYWYIEIIVLGLITATFYNLLASIIRALGDSKTPLYFLIIASVANIILALCFIELFNMGVAGSAVAVVLSQGVSVLLCLFYVKKKFPILHLKKQDWLIKFDKEFYNSALEHLKIGIPMAAQFSIIGIGVIVIQSVCNTFGSDVIAAITAALRIEQIATLPMVSFGVALASFVAQNFGAKKFRRIRTGVIHTSILSIVLSILMAIVMRFWGADIIKEFIGSATPKIIDIAHQYLMISTFFYIFLSQIFIYRNALQGMGEAIFPLMASIAELLMRAFAAIYLAIKFGYIGIFYSGPIAWISACIVLSFGYFRSIKPIVYKIKEQNNK
ncbi:TPA: MATE family efflux transporter [Candidatus Galligastranaerophilus intestinavium]|uniref:MATE family efflux transporter n=1 Tax=Candidatus Galligastranaerophilus intestinavium TaxID=2840836 RepID=A0A9D1JXQ5_9BACT|nr:MATE family efflux transporter [Candidatus Galligastranaerophilus intestinavium]